MNEIPTIGSNVIPKVEINGPNIIPTIEPPVIKSVEAPIIRGLALPIVNMPNPRINYPVIDVPTQEEFDAAVKADQKNQGEPQEKSRGLPDAKPPELPQTIQQLSQPITQTKTEIPVDNPTITVAGVNIDLPDPSVVATAGAVAIVTTATTMVATTVFNALKTATEPLIREASKNKFKIKIKNIKPVLHYVMAEDNNIDIFEYSSKGTRLIGQTNNVEQYLRDQIETNSLYEIENKIIIDDVITNKFTKEGKERFKSLFSPAHKIAKKLGAKLSF